MSRSSPFKFAMTGAIAVAALCSGGGIAEAQSGQSSTTVYVHADDLPATLARIEAHGGTTTMPPMDIPFAKISPAGLEPSLSKSARECWLGTTARLIKIALRPLPSSSFA